MAPTTRIVQQRRPLGVAARQQLESAMAIEVGSRPVRHGFGKAPAAVDSTAAISDKDHGIGGITDPGDGPAIGTVAEFRDGKKLGARDETAAFMRRHRVIVLTVQCGSLLTGGGVVAARRYIDNSPDNFA